MIIELDSLHSFHIDNGITNLTDLVRNISRCNNESSESNLSWNPCYIFFQYDWFNEKPYIVKITFTAIEYVWNIVKRRKIDTITY